MTGELERTKPVPEVLPNSDRSPTSIVLTVEEDYALWEDSQDDVDQLGRYWEHPALGNLVDRLRTWHKTEATW